MAKFGVFTGIKEEPDQVIEGDYLLQDGDIVKVIKDGKGSVGTHQVGAFNLEKRQVVKEVKE